MFCRTQVKLCTDNVLQMSFKVRVLFKYYKCAHTNWFGYLEENTHSTSHWVQASDLGVVSGTANVWWFPDQEQIWHKVGDKRMEDEQTCQTLKA